MVGQKGDVTVWGAVGYPGVHRDLRQSARLLDDDEHRKGRLRFGVLLGHQVDRHNEVGGAKLSRVQEKSVSWFPWVVNIAILAVIWRTRYIAEQGTDSESLTTSSSKDHSS